MQIFVIKSKTIHSTYLVRLSGAQKRKALAPWRFTCFESAATGWRKSKTAQAFLTIVQGDFDEGARLNGARNLDVNDLFEVVALER